MLIFFNKFGPTYRDIVRTNIHIISLQKYYPRKARGMLLDAMETCDVDFVKAAIDECERSGLPDTDPDVLGGRNRFEFLSCKTGIRLAASLIT